MHIKKEGVEQDNLEQGILNATNLEKPRQKKSRRIIQYKKHPDEEKKV